MISQEMHTKGCTGRCIIYRLDVWVLSQNSHQMAQENSGASCQDSVGEKMVQRHTFAT